MFSNVRVFLFSVVRFVLDIIVPCFHGRLVWCLCEGAARIGTASAEANDL